MIEIEFIGLNKAMAALDSFEAGLPDAAEAVMKSVGLSFVRAARMLAPVDSGELQNSIHSRVDRDGDIITGYGYTNSDHAAFVEFGTGPVGAAAGGNGSPVTVQYNLGPWLIRRGNFKKGVVVEQYANYWVYRGSDGKFHATRGQAPQPFMYPAFKAVEKQLPGLVKNAFRRYVRKGGGSSA